MAKTKTPYVLETVKVVKPHTKCKEVSTGLEGEVSHVMIMANGTSGQISYLFQPGGMDESNEPFARLLVTQDHLIGIKESDFIDFQFPSQILLSKAKHTLSGFTGTITELIRYPNGCVHIEIQPQAVPNKKIPKSREFDIRDCTGEKIPQQSDDEHEESIRKNPSPDNEQMSNYRRQPSGNDR